MKNPFNTIQVTRPKKSHFDLSHDVKLTCDLGKLVPVCVIDCLPTDKFQIGCNTLIRFSPLIAPVMHRYDVSIHYFFVPKRILWPNWEKYITGEAEVAAPYISISDGNFPLTGATCLANYLGLPKPDIGGRIRNVSALPFAAYQKIWAEYYRDQNLHADPAIDVIDGNNTGNQQFEILRYRCWEMDYFTSCLPFAQKGGTVNVPITDFEDIRVGMVTDTPGNVGQTRSWALTGGTAPGTAQAILKSSGAGTNGDLVVSGADIAGTTAINNLRRAFQLQKWLELDARAGSRYFEKIYAHFGYKGPDARLQRPEYITGIKTPIMVSEVLNTAATSGAISEGRVQGDMAGHAVGVAAGKYGTYFCQEHGYIMGLMSVMPKTAYQDGIPKHFLKINDPYEHAWPLFANIGEQEVLNKEVCAWQSDTTQDGVFGYQPRYQEYRFEQNRVCGDFRESLDFWHHGRKFDIAAPPALNANFVDCNPDKRIFAVEDASINSVYAHHLNKVSAVRPLPKYGTPLGI